MEIFLIKKVTSFWGRIVEITLLWIINDVKRLFNHTHEFINLFFYEVKTA